MAALNTGLDMGAEQLPSKEDLETYRIFFELFDRDSSGSIDAQDMAAIAFKLNRDPEEGKQLQLFFLLLQFLD